MQTNNLKTIILTAIVTALVVIGGIYLWQNFMLSTETPKVETVEIEETELESEEESIIQENDTELDTADPVVQQPAVTQSNNTTNWKTYTNNLYNYTVKYPANWYVDTTSSEKDFSQRGPAEDNTFMGGDTIFRNYPNQFSYNTGNPPPKDFFSVNLMIYKVPTTITFDEFISSEFRYDRYEKKENIIINGKNALQLTRIDNDIFMGQTGINTFIKVEDKMFSFSYAGNPITQEMKDNAKGIINSFVINN